MTGGGATTAAFGIAQDISAIEMPSSAQVVIFQLAMMNSHNSGTAAPRRKKPVYRPQRKAEARCN